MTTPTKPLEIKVQVCPPRCLLHEDGEHRWTEIVSLGTYENGNSMGESVACKCGIDAFGVDIMRMP